MDAKLTLGRVRDDISLELMSVYGGRSRELSLALKAVDEAILWLIQHGLNNGAYILVDKQEWARKLRETE